MDLLHGPIASPRTEVHVRANRFNGYNDYGVARALKTKRTTQVLSCSSPQEEN
jgi:hypothetical protein